jgi:hypothetical protein
LTQYNSEKQALLNSGSLSCPSCSTFFNGDPTRASYFGQLTNAVTTQVPYDGVQSTISQYDAGMLNTILTANNPIAVKIYKNTPVCGLFKVYKGNAPQGLTVAAAQVTPPSGTPATDVYVNTSKQALKLLTQGTILHETMHNLSGLDDFVSSDFRTLFAFPAPYDLKTLLGIEPTPGVDPTPGSTIDITAQLQQNQCAATN